MERKAFEASPAGRVIYVPGSAALGVALGLTGGVIGSIAARNPYLRPSDS